MTTISSSPQIYLTRGLAGCQLAARLGAVAIVVDALRASATLPTLLDRGVERVLVVSEVADARALALQVPGAMLVGERMGEKLPGFDLGNSPLEALAAKELAPVAIFTSSNGAQRLTACTGANTVLVGTICNARALVAWVRPYASKNDLPVVLIAAGQYPDEEFISPEDDAVCAYLAQRLDLPINEASQKAFVAEEAQLQHKGMPAIFNDSLHAQHLIEIGYCDDVNFCCRIDVLHSLPAVTAPVLLGDKVVGVEVRGMKL